MLSAANFYLVPAGSVPEGRPFRPMVEVALIVSEPQYTVDAAGQSVRHRTMDTMRFHTSPEGLRDLAKYLGKWADDAEKMTPDEPAAGEGV
jgi:hypothetical protein